MYQHESKTVLPITARSHQLNRLCKTWVVIVGKSAPKSDRIHNPKQPE
ncbi:hypothetical protein JYQ62_11140 [Nostoc sp. UHCC 0702]|nr:hypothetical protein JYQ62_11140 [Nostoc sp. UHCC 0702]